MMPLSKGESERFTNLTPHSLIDPVIYYVMEDIFYRAPSSIIQCPRSYALPKWLQASDHFVRWGSGNIYIYIIYFANLSSGSFPPMLESW